MASSVNDRLQDETIAHGLYVNRYGNRYWILRNMGRVQ